MPLKRGNGAPKTLKPSQAETSKDTRNNFKNINPIKRSSETVGRAGDLRRQRDAMATKIEEEKAEQEREMAELRDRIRFYKGDNAKLLRQQAAKFGLTLDSLKDVQNDLSRARSINDSLFREVEARKEECEKLENERDTILQRINQLAIEDYEFQREKRIHERELEQVLENNTKIQALVKANKEMRTSLIKHKINPSSDASKLKMTSRMTKHDERYPERDTSLPVIYTNRNVHNRRGQREKMPPRRSNREKLRRTMSDARDYIRSSNEVFLLPQYQHWARVH